MKTLTMQHESGVPVTYEITDGKSRENIGTLQAQLEDFLVVLQEFNISYDSDLEAMRVSAIVEE